MSSASRSGARTEEQKAEQRTHQRIQNNSLAPLCEAATQAARAATIQHEGYRLFCTCPHAAWAGMGPAVTEAVAGCAYLRCAPAPTAAPACWLPGHRSSGVAMLQAILCRPQAVHPHALGAAAGACLAVLAQHVAAACTGSQHTSAPSTGTRQVMTTVIILLGPAKPGRAVRTCCRR